MPFQVPMCTHSSITLIRCIIFKHSVKNPMISIGTGRTNFLSFLGNWRIDDNIDEKIELRNFTIASYLTSDTITFTGDGYSRVWLEKLNAFTSRNVNLTLMIASNQSMVLSLTNNGPDFQYSWLRIAALPEEMVWGGGEQFSHLNLRERSYTRQQFFSVLHPKDQTYPIWTREQGVGRNKSDKITFFADLQTGGGGAYHTTYFPQPSFISSQQYYFHYTGSNYAVMDFSNPIYHEVMFYGNVEQIFFKKEESLMNVVKSLSTYLGTMPPLPDWVTDGMILGVQGGTNVMLQKYKDATDQGVAINGLWIQDWAGQFNTSFGSRLYWNWKWNEQRYPGDIYNSVQGKGYFVKKVDGSDYIIDFGEFKCATVDLTDTTAYNWYKDLVKRNMVDLGLGGWMADFGEYTPVDGVYANGSGFNIHNLYPVLWAKLNREAITERGKDGEIVFWMRAGYSGISAYTTLMWAGDQNVDFDYADGVPSTVVSALSMGMSGTGMTHFDIGGYTTYGALGLQRSAEVLMRSAEMAQFQRLTKLFTLLQNYTNDVIHEYSTNGIPVQRPLFLMYENDKIAQNVKFQYMYGPDLLVAPVIESKATSWKVYLPQGDSWIYLWNNTKYNGGAFVTVTSPIGLPPVFYRQGSTYTNTFTLMSKIKPIKPP
ncbi:hypothetical protein KUTeg_023811, partial [Tegillarca granosa]